MAITVNSDNFVRAETARMFHDLQRDAGGVNLFSHNRTPAAIDAQTVIRLNRDTLYSFAVVDLAEGATLTVPEHGDRYLSVMIVDEDHLIHRTYHDAGSYPLSAAEHGTRYVTVAARVLVDPNDPADLAAVHAVQDGLLIEAVSSDPFVLDDYDTESFDETRSALLTLASRLTGYTRMFGSADEVDPVRHLIGTAAGWGGLPTSEAVYVGANPRLAPGRYELTVRDVPVDGFWSISVYNAAGFFEPNASSAYTINDITAVKNDDGSVTVRFGDFPEGTPNVIPTPEGWNYLVRLYRPHPEILDGSWSFPVLGA
ncbi:DUF1254 domain-containing protein [Herbiconiux moechotypicola]|nr:DUF1214 domain-containing protein [Herbiconiux moechotypicola]MCS5730337.1 DUF1254 domain-containing protein [Herbiconiux moechotypicola]